jgi:hypothetical protein
VYRRGDAIEISGRTGCWLGERAKGAAKQDGKISTVTVRVAAASWQGEPDELRRGRIVLTASASMDGI